MRNHDYLQARHPWPGNLRELEHTVESAVVLCEASEIGPAHLALAAGGGEAVAAVDEFRPRTLAEVEREFLDTARVAEREIKETDDFVVIARAAHRLKGASGMIGAASLRQIAEAVERAAKAHDLPTVRRLREMFTHEVRRVAEQAGVAVE